MQGLVHTCKAFWRSSSSSCPASDACSSLFSTLEAQLRAAACTCKPVSVSSLTAPSGTAPFEIPQLFETETDIECLIVSNPIVTPNSSLLLAEVVRVQSAWQKQKVVLLAACKASAFTAACQSAQEGASTLNQFNS